ncbi:two-component system sensor histidine kinase [Sphingobium sp. SYK-6]|uniref:sensor histidine kinase n=1 Tax=Sphingobium sp. (strain NBRC 103272 / SYK-6) TaxID=627192 RepID=UPI00022766F5|nr:ATP-binding protein [Sphingobium sp. SYK-6]BAK65750.1 two-component system sensor histidine kinase [Sphingobium sp. SYK-6]
MRQVFTLWPGDDATVRRNVTDDGIPTWAVTPGASAPAMRWTNLDWSVLVIASTLIIALALVVPADLTGWISAGLLSALSIGLVILGVMIHRRRVAGLLHALDESRRWNDTIFERTGISLWREDWSYARDAVLALLRSGVRDMQAHFAAHPDQLREIRRHVIIKDVNQFAVSRSRAPDKQALLGSLDGLLPDTDQTFVQWLVAFANGDSFYRSETHITLPDGEAVDTLFTAGLPTDMQQFEDILVSDLDITEYKATQARLAQAELDMARAVRVSTMGALTASIAHEINSPLAAIVANAEASLRWMRRHQPDLVEAEQALECVLTAAMRTKAVVEQTRAFLSNAPLKPAPQDMARLVHDAIILIDRELRTHGISTHVDAHDGLPPVMADAVNIQQVLVNLMMNAAQAMEGVDGAKDLTIAIRHEEDRLHIEVRDRGIGIDRASLETIFDPFYSSRPDGMGMGLAICRTCISAHGGRIWAESSLGEGSTFHFDLPVAEEEMARA